MSALGSARFPLKRSPGPFALRDRGKLQRFIIRGVVMAELKG